MNDQLMKVSLGIATAINVLLAGVVIYQNRGMMQSNDPKLPHVVSKQIRSLETRLSAAQAEAAKNAKASEAQLKDLRIKAEDSAKSMAAKIEQSTKSAAQQAKDLEARTEAKLQEYAKQIKEGVTRSDRFENSLQSLGATLDKGVNKVTGQKN